MSWWVSRKGKSGEQELLAVDFDPMLAMILVVVPIGPADVRGIRDELGRSQAEFALMIGVGVATLQNSEQGRRRPVGPARALLKVAASNPRLVMQALAS